MDWCSFYSNVFCIYGEERGFQSVYVPTLTFGKKLYVETKSINEKFVSFARFSLREKERSSDIHEELGFNPLLIQVKRSKLRWLEQSD